MALGREYDLIDVTDVLELVNPSIVSTGGYVNVQDYFLTDFFESDYFGYRVYVP